MGLNGRDGDLQRDRRCTRQARFNPPGTPATPPDMNTEGQGQIQGVGRGGGGGGGGRGLNVDGGGRDLLPGAGCARQAKTSTHATPQKKPGVGRGEGGGLPGGGEGWDWGLLG